jgi:hypothetical protein
MTPGESNSVKSTWIELTKKDKNKENKGKEDTPDQTKQNDKMNPNNNKSNHDLTSLIQIVW